MGGDGTGRVKGLLPPGLNYGPTLAFLGEIFKIT
jgi:hypothetical protein